MLVASEVNPLAQTGGLADVAGSLPTALNRQGAETAIIMPGYQAILDNPDFSFEDTGTNFTIDHKGEEVTGFLLRGEQAPGVPLWLVVCEPYFGREGIYGYGGVEYTDNAERFSFFCKAVIKLLPKLDSFPDIILGNDWQTGLLMAYLAKAGLNRPRGVFVIHNQGYLGLVPPEDWSMLDLPESYNTLEGLEYFGQSSMLKAGIVYSQAVITVSPSYASEIQTPESGQGLDGTMRHHRNKLTGILNGVDYDIWNPKTDKLIPHNYSASNLAGKKKCKKALRSEMKLTSTATRPLIGVVGRLAAQKGISLIADVAEDIFRLGADLVILGSGDLFYEELCRALAARFSDNCKVHIGYDNALAHRVIAGSDFIMVPSMYEPCGLVQIYALRYGTVPIVRGVGGLNDTIRDFAGQNPEGLWDTGFKFSQFQDKALVLAVRRAVELYASPKDFKAMIQAGMAENYSWDSSAREYLLLFEKVLTL